MGKIPIRITVYDYSDELRSSSYAHQNSLVCPRKWEVDALCVGGDCGILALFKFTQGGKEYCGIASGDDGHWWLIRSCHEAWYDKIRETWGCEAQ